ncbi:radical SAM protein [Candidatus Uabimicrobium sp. HlEnr_7]|uniref:radical SAM protein n=1 Tax=Candidatus Uabimicrobium helgolandensis TaxID=3095367 RepID=UPI0035563FC8
MFTNFGLTLMVNHACNLRCTYCYTGSKFQRRMDLGTAKKAIDRAIASITDDGTIELGFFGGEPLVESGLILQLLDYVSLCAEKKSIRIVANITTNGTIVHEEAWQVMTHPHIFVAISCDGLPEVHDSCRITVDGKGTSSIVIATIQKLLAAQREFRVVMVVRPNNLSSVAKGIEYLFGLGVKQADLSLDLWTKWGRKDSLPLQAMIKECAQVWRKKLPTCGVNWFDEKTIKYAQIPTNKTARCSFGNGEIAVSPAGNLYPCERLIGEDSELNAMRMPGHVMDGKDNFLPQEQQNESCHEECRGCSIQSLCSTSCQCSNYIRTGKTREPDLLLCMVNKLCMEETLKALKTLT